MKRSFDSTNDFEDGEIEEDILSLDGDKLNESSFEERLDEELMQRPNLPVIRPETDVPMTGEEYLYFVREERNRLPKVKTADKVRSEPKFLSELIKLEDFFKDAKNLTLLPDDEWEQATLDAFVQDRFTWSEQLENFDSTDSKEPFVLPALNDEQSWKRWLYGRDSESREPSLPVMSELGHVAKMRLFLYHSRWIYADNVFEQKAYNWVYSLMCNTIEGLSSEDVSILRALARSCATIRSGINALNFNADLLANLNAVITIVRKFYRQSDLH